MPENNKDEPSAQIPLTLNVDEKTEKTTPKDESARPLPMVKIILSGKMPKTFFLIIGNEFCERFCFYGMRAVLTLYLREFIGQSNVTATNIYHVFTLLAYFMPLLGAIISDSWLGKFKTILYLSIVYAFGIGLMAILAIPSVGHRNLGGVIVALIIISIGTGGIKPCVSSFGADQFEGKTEYLDCFFSAFYMSINAGSVLSMIITPLIRGVKCFPPKDDPECVAQSCDCYALAFGVPAILMVLAIVFFVVGFKWYIKVPPLGSAVVTFGKSVISAIRNIIKKKKPVRQVKHWLDNADAVYDRATLNDYKQILSVAVLFSPLCFFWTLYDQTGSTWVIQGRMMKQQIGSWKITPDIIQAVNPILVLILVPLFDSVVYNQLAKCNFLVKLLHRMVAGMFLAALAFVITGILQVAIVNDLKRNQTAVNQTLYSLYGSSQIGVHNKLPCPLNVEYNGNLVTTIAAGTAIRMLKEDVVKQKFWSYCTNGTLSEIPVQQRKLLVVAKNAFGDILIGREPTTWFDRVRHSIHPRLTWRSLSGFTLLPRFVALSESEEQQSSIPILYQVFQYLVMTTAEILFSVSGLHFAYAEASQSLKSIMTSIWLLTNSVGNLITIIINTAAGDTSHEFYIFFVYAALICVVDGVFMILVKRYVPRERRLKEAEVYMNELDTKAETISDTDVDG